MPLPDALVEDVHALGGDERFKKLWRYIESLDKGWTQDILSSHTDKDRREVLVLAREMLTEEVLSIPETARKKIEKQQNQGGKPIER